ncbi:MAG: ATP-grasp domain-containing protein [Planctomycetes bacterium]|nr:ATP-grasp domain-containing protein [Planctomycetota bacterium]
MGWCPPSWAALSSRYVAKVHPIPAYDPTDDLWKRSLISILQRERPDLVIPTNDKAILPLQAHRADFADCAPIYLLDERAFEVACDKFKTCELAAALGIPIPPYVIVSRTSEVDSVLRKLQLPVVLKPRASYRLRDLSNRRHVRKAYTKEDLEAYLKTMLPEGKVLVQQSVPGSGVGVEVLAHEKEILLAFQHVRIHESLMGGGTYRKSVPVQPELLDAVAKLVRALNYTGVAMMEFRVDFRTGGWFLLEINGRFWGSLPLAVAAGADFPYSLYQLLVEGKRDFPQGYRKGIYCRTVFADMRWMRQDLKAGRSDKTRCGFSFWQAMGEAMNILTFQERTDTFAADDLKPGFVKLWRFGLDVANKIQSQFLSVPVIRKAHAERARRALCRARNVLFVCYGNICRSPFAQCYAQRVFPNSLAIASSGYYPEEGRACPKAAIDAAAEMGINLAEHRSRIVSEADVREADVIFTFDEENYRSLIARYPFVKQRVHRLGVLLSHGPVSIRDPYGGSMDDFRAVYRSIADCIGSFIMS